MSVEEEEWILTLDQLPYLCLMKICEFLKVDDLARFSRVCKVKRDIIYDVIIASL